MTVVINLKTEEEVKKQAQVLARSMGLSLSAVINALLRDFIQQKEIRFSAIKYPKQKEKNWVAEEKEEIKSGKSYANTDELFDDVFQG